MRLLMRVAIVGSGRMAQTVHLPLVQALVGLEVAAIVDPHMDAEQLRSLAVEYDAQPLKQIAPGIADLAIVSTPISTHAEAGMLALEAGCHVLLEKPFVHSPEEGASVLAAAAEKDLRVFVGHVRRFWRSVVDLRDLIASGALGDVMEVRMHEGNLYGWNRAFFAKDRQADRSVDEGVLFDVGSHAVDVARFVLGDLEPEFVVTESTTEDVSRQAEVLARGSLSLAAQPAARWSASFSNSTTLANCLWIVGTRGTALLPVGPDESPIVFTPRGKRLKAIADSASEDPFVAQLQDVVDAIRSGSASRLDASEALGTVDVLHRLWVSRKVGVVPWRMGPVTTT